MEQWLDFEKSDHFEVAHFSSHHGVVHELLDCIFMCINIYVKYISYIHIWVYTCYKFINTCVKKKVCCKYLLISYIYTCTNVCICACACVCIYIHIYVHNINIYIYIISILKNARTSNAHECTYIIRTRIYTPSC